MKKSIVSIAIAGLMATGSALAVDMPQEAHELNCIACHRIDTKLVGPAWMDVSRKYKGATDFEYSGKTYPLHEGLIMKVSKGGSGHWGSMPMPPNDPAGVKKDKIDKLVTFIQGLAK